MKRIADQMMVFLAWAVTTTLGFWVMVVVRQAFMSSLAILYVEDSIRRGWTARFWGQAYYVVAGLVYLIFIFVVDGYLKDGQPKRDVFRRFCTVAGLELLILFVADIVTSLMQGVVLGQLSRIIMPVEGILGVAMLVYARLRKGVDRWIGE
ncbi:MAG: hypothetical protein MUF84_05380 [Anaerolineae bacterium]|nr:hypothetical protein [Anaerolineae bacterium]